MVGRSLGHYTAEPQFGNVGVGGAYLAQDIRLKRSVALKLLHVAARRDPKCLQRFRFEAEASSKLEHPSAATVDSIKQPTFLNGDADEQDGRGPILYMYDIFQGYATIRLGRLTMGEHS